MPRGRSASISIEFDGVILNLTFYKFYIEIMKAGILQNLFCVRVFGVGLWLYFGG